MAKNFIFSSNNILVLEDVTLSAEFFKKAAEWFRFIITFSPEFVFTRGFLMFAGDIERDQWHEMSE